MEPNYIPQTSPIKKFLIVLVFVFVIFGVCFLVYFLINKPNGSSIFVQDNNISVDKKDVKNQPKIVQIDTSSVKIFLPKDILQEENIQILKSFMVPAEKELFPDGHDQVSFSYLSNYNIKKNLELYNDYLKKNGWASKTAGNDIFSSITAKKNNLSLVIMVSSDIEKDKYKVDLTVVGDFFSKLGPSTPKQ